ncbi:oxidoreductase [Bacteroidia bacterium]|nr:oxidoreductase [Bacteroidia bacterium]
MNLLEGKIAIVTGGSRGIGRAICETYVKEGARVVIADVNCEEANATAAEIGDLCSAISFDVTNKADIGKKIDSIWETVGPIDIWVNNAGISEQVPFEELEERSWDKILAVDLKGVFLCSQAIFIKMKGRGGKIINMSSMAGERGGKVSGAHYSAAKGGVNTLTKVLALQGGEYGITANAITPGLIATQMAIDLGWINQEHKDIPLGRLGTAQDIANAAVFLGSYLSDYVTGDIIKVNGGMYMG